MKKEILLLSSLISLSIVLYLGIPGNENMDHKNIVEDEILESEVNNLPDDKLNKDPILKFDIVRLDPKGNIIIAGKTIPDAEVQIFDGNEKLSTGISDSHGDWVWVSENQIEDFLAEIVAMESLEELDLGKNKISVFTKLAEERTGIKLTVFSPRKRELFASIVSYLDSRSLNILDAKVDSTLDGYALNTFLTEEMELTSIQYAKLYGVYRSDNTLMLKSKYEVSTNADREINNLRVPLLKTVVFQMRKLLNLLIDTYGPIDEIKASLSIDLKINKYQRYLYRLDQKRLEGLRETYMQKLGAMAENLTPLNLTKYELWKECKNTCPYTGKYIPLEELFSDRIKVVYIHPWEWSLNDSILNKTLCDASLINQIKSKTPVEYFQENAPEHWEGVVKRAARLFSNTKEFPSSYKKFKRFVKRYNKRNVFKHLMDDPNAISRKIQHYLERVVPKVGVSAGHTNALFIEKWQLKKVFEPSVYERYDLDWRFAAFDAYINANRELHYFEILVEQNKYLPRSKKVNFPIPYDDFREDLNYHLHSILVSHKKDSRILSTRHKMVSIDKTPTINKEVSVRGSLHKESIYGLRQQPHSELKSFHIRKPIESFTTLKQVEKVIDPVVKSIMLKTILDHNGFNGDIIPRNTFSDFSQSGKKFHKVFMPNAKGDPVPIKKVRIRENLTGTAKLKQNLNQHVNLRKNHHVVIYKDNTGKYQEYITSFWEAVQRARKMEDEVTPRTVWEIRKEVVTITKRNK